MALEHVQSWPEWCPHSLVMRLQSMLAPVRRSAWPRLGFSPRRISKTMVMTDAQIAECAKVENMTPAAYLAAARKQEASA